MLRASVVKNQSTLSADESKTTRREFLYYLWGASIALTLGGASAGIVWYTQPRPRRGEIVTADFPDLPRTGDAPLAFPQQHLHICRTDEDTLVALYGFCTFRRDNLPKWVPLNHRFECPACGSKYRLDGLYIEGPAPRNLDRYHMIVTFADGTTATTNEHGDPIAVEGREIASVTVDTRRLIEGAPRR